MSVEGDHRGAAGTSPDGSGPILRLPTPPTTGFKLWMSRRKYKPTASITEWIRPTSMPQSVLDPHGLVVDATAESVLADVPGVDLPSESDFGTADHHALCVSSGQRPHWRPGEHGNPGVARDRTVVLPSTALVAVDVARCAVGNLDHKSDPVLVHVCPSHSTRTHPGWTRRAVSTTDLARDRAAYRDALHAVDCCLIDVSEHASSVDAAFIVACAAMMGIPVVVRQSTSAFERRLDPDLRATVSQLDEVRLRTDGHYRGIAGVAMRRHALRAHSASAVWGTVVGSPPPRPHVMVIVPSIRPSFAGRVVDALNAQTYREFDAQIALDHGTAGQVELAEHLERATFPSTVRRHDDLANPGAVCNDMMRTADADIAIVWNDEDHYGRHHVEDLVAGLIHSGDLLAAKNAEFFHLEHYNMTMQRPARGGTAPARGPDERRSLAMWRAPTVAFRGFPPFTRDGTRQLIERVHEAGCGLHQIHGYEYVVPHQAVGSMWNPGEVDLLDGSVRQWPGLALHAAGFGSLDDVTPAVRYR